MHIYMLYSLYVDLKTVCFFSVFLNEFYGLYTQGRLGYCQPIGAAMKRAITARPALMAESTIAVTTAAANDMNNTIAV